MRLQARSLKATDILKECDKLRDDVLPNVGVRLEDRENEASAVKFVGREVLLKEKEAKKQAELEKLKEKERKKAELLAAQAAKEAQRKIPPSEMFKMEKDKYSKFDDKVLKCVFYYSFALVKFNCFQGLPTHDVEGKELSKGQIKKLQKLQQAQEKKYQEYINTL